MGNHSKELGSLRVYQFYFVPTKYFEMVVGLLGVAQDVGNYIDEAIVQCMGFARDMAGEIIFDLP